MVARHWIQLKEKYGDDVRVIQTDTDSIHFKLYNHNLYADIEEDLKEKRRLIGDSAPLSFEAYIKKIEPVLGKPREGLRLRFSDIFDLSSLPKNHPCSDQEHRKCFGYMKLENKGKPIDYFVAPVVKGYREQIGQKVKITLKGITEVQQRS